MELFDHVDRQGLLVLGWIHTHPSQTRYLRELAPRIVANALFADVSVPLVLCHLSTCIHIVPTS